MRLIVCFFLLATNLVAKDLVTRSGIKYRDYEIVSVDPDGLNITYVDGAMKVPFTKLPDDIQSRYNYDPLKAAQFTQEAKSRQVAAAAAASKIRAAELTRKQAAENAKQAALARLAEQQRAVRATPASDLEPEPPAHSVSVKSLSKIEPSEDKESNFSPVTGGLLILILIGLYFFPTIVAMQKDHHNSLAIGVLNLFLGWSLIGWVIALVWACISAPPRT